MTSKIIKSASKEITETQFKNKVFRFLDSLPNTWYVKVQQVGIRGTPDVLLCVRGMFVAIELKRSQKVADKMKKDKTGALQLVTLNRIAQANGIAMVCYPENFQSCCSLLGELAAAEIIGPDHVEVH